MLSALNDLDTALFLALNGALPELDGVMWWVSKPLFWTPLYLAMLWAVGRQLGWGRPMALFAACVALCVTGTDVISARVLKPSVARLRPSHEPALVHDVHLVEERPGELYRGGRFSFVSSHAANHMGIAVLFGGLLGGAWAWGLLAWALLIGFSRIHLGVHYPGDVLGGFLVGWGIGALALQIARHWIAPFPKPQTMAEGITAMTWLAVFMGGGVGSVLRFGLGQGLRAVALGSFPWAVLAANVLATALLAWCAVTGAELWGRTSPMWFFMTVGVCGGFSTFSTFAWDTLRLWQDGGWMLAMTNVAVSVVGCVAVSWWVAQITS